MKLSIKDEILAFRSELVALRREFHRFPEPGYKEFRTSKTIYDYLKSVGCDSVRNVCKTGIVGTVAGNRNNGRSVMLRATIDGTPIQEKTGLDYASVNPGFMHAGGSDAQMAVALVVSKLLKRHRDMFGGTFQVVFQPNGQLSAAADLIAEGLLEEFHPNCCLATHFSSSLESGKVGLSAGVVTGSTNQFIIRLKGNFGSQYMPHQVKDPIFAASKIVDSLQYLETRLLDPFTTVRIMFGKINGGTARNVTPKEVSLEGSIRILNPEGADLNTEIEHEFKKAVEYVCGQVGIEYELEFLNRVNSIVNDSRTVSVLRNAAERIYQDPGSIVDHRTLMSEDFSEFSRRVPSALTFFGITNEAKHCIYPNNHAQFELDEDVLTDAAEFYFRSIIELLNQKEY